MGAHGRNGTIHADEIAIAQQIMIDDSTSVTWRPNYGETELGIITGRCHSYPIHVSVKDIR
jgi:hypothetical protein